MGGAWVYVLASDGTPAGCTFICSPRKKTGAVIRADYFLEDSTSYAQNLIKKFKTTIKHFSAATFVFELCTLPFNLLHQQRSKTATLAPPVLRPRSA